MKRLDDNDAGSGMDFFIRHPGREVVVAHYLRQVTITRRRQAPWINRAWCRDRRAFVIPFLWKR